MTNNTTTANITQNYADYDVYDYDTDELLLEGVPSHGLVDASLACAPGGAVSAYLADGTWHHVRQDDETLLQGQGHDVRTVYCYCDLNPRRARRL
jgi:hypothetical protein